MIFNRASVSCLALAMSCAVLSLCSCASDKQEQMSEQRDLNQRYPLGTERATILRRYGIPIRSIALPSTGKADDPFVADYLSHLPGASAAVLRQYDVYTAPGTPVTPGAAESAFYSDYLFYDASDHLLRSTRRYPARRLGWD